MRPEPGQRLAGTNRALAGFSTFAHNGSAIAFGCPLSPLLGGLHLAQVDRAMSDQRWFYVRFMDDLLVLAPSRPRLRKAVKQLHGLFDGLHPRMHPEKTFVGRWEMGFEFLGPRIDPACETDASPVCQPDAMTPVARPDPPARGQPTLGEVLATPPSCRVEVVVGSRAASGDGDAASPPRPTRPIRLRPAQASWARFVPRTRRLDEQGAPSARLYAYLRHGLRLVCGQPSVLVDNTSASGALTRMG